MILQKHLNIKVFVHLYKKKLKLLEKCLNIFKMKLINFINLKQMDNIFIKGLNLLILKLNYKENLHHLKYQYHL